MSEQRIDLSHARELLTTALATIQNLHNRRIPEGEGRQASAAKAEITRELQYLAYLCDRAQVDVLGAYHEGRGYTAHIRPTEEDFTR